jgi:dihydrofolate reductase
MWAAEHSIETTASPESIWRRWSDVASWGDWNADIERIEISGPFAAGSTIAMTPAGQDAVELRLSEVAEPTLFVDEADLGDVVIRTFTGSIMWTRGARGSPTGWRSQGRPRTGLARSSVPRSAATSPRCSQRSSRGQRHWNPNRSADRRATMGKITAHEFITLDGVIEAPTWTADYPFDPKMGQRINRIMEASDALLLGRRTFEMFAASWPNRSAEDDPGAPFMNESRKYVVSGTLESADWTNSTILGPYDAEEIGGLKERTDGNLYVSGSGMLVRQMLADGLVDELHLFVFPLTLASGERLFADGDAKVKFDLVETETYDSGVVYSAYRPAG